MQEKNELLAIKKSLNEVEKSNKNIEKLLRNINQNVSLMKYVALEDKELDPSFIFGHIYEAGLWGNGSGSGSNIKLNEGYIKVLESFMQEKGIASVCDIGCGDWQFSKFIDYSKVIYTGYDVAERVIEENKKKFTSDNVNFIHYYGDFSQIQPADLAITREVLQHLPNEYLHSYIKELYKFKYAIIANVYIDESPNRDIKLGQCRPLDLRRDPFNLDCKEFFRISRPHREDIVFFLWENPMNKENSKDLV